jgi:outer membrane immunogenic protein
MTPACPADTIAAGGAPGGRVLRVATALCFLLAAVYAERARGADWPDDSFLRGSLTPATGYARWDGPHFGGQIGLSNMNTDFGNGTSSHVAYILRNTTLQNEAAPSDWTALPANTTNARQAGAFVGYNVQWDELVLGADMAYNRPATLEASAADSISRRVTTSDGYENNVTVIAQSSIKLIDYATFRARAGYAFGQFLPYAVLGVAVGRFNYTTSATVTASGTDISGGGGSPYGPITATESSTKDNSFAAGFVAGLGLDVAVLPDVFLRAEWEYIAFAPVHGLRTSLSTGRVGVGVRF